MKETNFNRMFSNQDNSGYDWNIVQNSINNNLKNNWITSNFTVEQIKNLQSISKNKIDQLNLDNATSEDAISNFKLQSPQFKDVYENHQNAFKNINQKINVQFFGMQKVDLNLDGSNTYDDVINTLNIAINSQYPGNNIIVSLVDNKIANNYLFDDSTTASLSTFINDRISINVNVQFGNNKPETKTINLTNVNLDPVKEDTWLYKSITSYFNQLNPQDLGLTATNTRDDAFKSLINKINERFNIKIGQNENDHSGIQISLVNTADSKDNFMQKENINYVMDQNMYFDVNIADYNSPVPKITKQHLYLKNINFNFDNMKQVINQLWLNNDSKNNPVDLRVTSDQTYQDIVNSFNQRMENLNQKDHFQIRLTDPSLANQKIDKNYDPRNPEFKSNVEFGYLKNGQFQSLGVSDLHLSNVKLSKEDQKIKQKFGNLFTIIDALNALSMKLGVIALTAGILALASLVFAPEISGQFTFIVFVSGAASLTLKIYLSEIEQQISSLDLIADIFSGIGLIISAIVILLSTLLASFTADVAVLAIAPIFFSIVSKITTIIDDVKNWIIQ